MQQVVSMISSIPVTANSVVWWHVNGLCSTTLIPHDKMFALLWLNDDLFEIRFVVLYCFLYFCLYLGWCVAVSVQYQPCHPQVGKHHIENSHLKHEDHAVFHTIYIQSCTDTCGDQQLLFYKFIYSFKLRYSGYFNLVESLFSLKTPFKELLFTLFGSV